MARRQKEIPGFEKQIENPVIEAAAESFVEANAAWKKAAKTRGAKQIELLATLRSEKREQYEFVDENGNVMVAKIVYGDEKAVVEKSGESESSPDDETADTDGLVAQAQKAQKDANVEEDPFGDVVVPETSVPKKKRKKKS